MPFVNISNHLNKEVMLHKSLEISYFDNMGNNILRTGQQD